MYIHLLCINNGWLSLVAHLSGRRHKKAVASQKARERRARMESEQVIYM